MDEQYVRDIEQGVSMYLQKYSYDELWKILIFEWQKAEYSFVPVRGKREDIAKFLTGVVGEIRQRIRVNQAVMPSIVTATVGEVISHVSAQYPEIIQYKIPIIILAAVVAQSVQAQLVKEPSDTENTS